jgi:hypothetical protein
MPISALSTWIALVVKLERQLFTCHIRIIQWSSASDDPSHKKRIPVVLSRSSRAAADATSKRRSESVTFQDLKETGRASNDSWDVFHFTGGSQIQPHRNTSCRSEETSWPTEADLPVSRHNERK